MSRSIIVCLMQLFALSQPAHAAINTVEGNIQCVNICRIEGLTIAGRIDHNTEVQFERLISLARERAAETKKDLFLSGTQVFLNSPGGSVSSAMAIGRLMRKERLHAWVLPGSSCNSSCVLIYAGAVGRFGHNDASKIGIHQPFFAVPSQSINPVQVREQYDAFLIKLRVYLREMNVSEQLADEMLKTSPSNVRFLNADDQERYGLTVLDPIEREVLSLEEAQELGIDRREYNRREALSAGVCGFTPGCREIIMKTGRAP